MGAYCIRQNQVTVGSASPREPGRTLGSRGKSHGGYVCASREAAVKVKQVVQWLLIAFVVWWVVTQPGNAGHLVHNIGSLLSNAAHGLASFVGSI